MGNIKGLYVVLLYARGILTVYVRGYNLRENDMHITLREILLHDISSSYVVYVYVNTLYVDLPYVKLLYVKIQQST